MNAAPSPLKRREIIDALRSGTVPKRGLELFAVGLDRFEKAIDEELDAVAAGNGKFKAVQGDYGAGKTFFSRWLEHRAREKGFATAQVQISETETPLYRMETVYRRAVEGLQTRDWADGAFSALLDRWFFSLEDEVLASGEVAVQEPEAIASAVGSLLERRLADVSATQPEFAAALRACHTARVRGDHATSDGLIGWLMGNPNVGAGIKRTADIKGDLDHFGAGGFIRGLLAVLKQTGRRGLVLVLDEVETIQRVRRESREKSLNALRQLIDDVANQRFPGLYVLVTGTESFFTSSRGVGGLDPLAQRLHVDFGKDPKFDSARAVRIRLPPFDRERLLRVGARVRDLYPTTNPERVVHTVTDPVLGAIADKVAGQLGKKIGVTPRIFLKRLVNVLDKVDEHADYDPIEHEDFKIEPNEMTAEERLSAGIARSVDDIALDLGDSEPEAGGARVSAFERLSGALQHQIVSRLGWSSLRPVQEQSIDAILAGDNCIVLAPTAGGKTEAAFFPVFSRMHDEAWQPISCLYLSPIRALLNNQEERLGHYADLVGRRVFKWHGDVSSSARTKFLREPADLVLTTPESLEAMLMSARFPARELFAGLRAVVIDEIHSFANDDRGAHLACVLERLIRYAGHDVQRIGLSATVGNPDEILRWVSGSSKRPGRIVNPGGAKKTPELSLDFVGSLENAARVVKELHPGKKRLVFVDARRQAELLGQLLDQDGVRTFVTHGSLAVSERQRAEEAFATGKDCVIVATSALELGIDVGDLDHVLQIDSPPSVASFLQRMGRTGRRDDASPNCTFLATKDSGVLQAAALLRLYRQGFVEAVHPSRRASHILAHQLMALAVQLGGVEPGGWWPWLSGATSFAGLSAEDRASIVAHMEKEDILRVQDAKLWLGDVGEKKYGRANFRKLYAVFEAPRLVVVSWNTREIGTVDAKFLATIDSDEERGSFILGGKAWQIAMVDWERGQCEVRPAAAGKATRWGGGSRFLGYELCQSMREVLVGNDQDPAWSQRAAARIKFARAEHSFLADGERAPLLGRDKTIEWWTFAGGAANTLLAKILEADLGEKITAQNTHLTFKDGAGKSEGAIRERLAELREARRPTAADALRFSQSAERIPISKFQACLPEPLLADLLAEKLLDIEGAHKTLHSDT